MEAKTGWMNKKKAADYASVSVGTISEWMKRGLRHSRPGKKTTLFLPEFIDEFVYKFAAAEDEDRIEKIVSEITEGL